VSSSWLATSQGAIMLLLGFVIRHGEPLLAQKSAISAAKSSNLLVSFRKSAEERGSDTRYSWHQLQEKHV